LYLIENAKHTYTIHATLMCGYFILFSQVTSLISGFSIGYTCNDSKFIFAVFCREILSVHYVYSSIIQLLYTFWLSHYVLSNLKVCVYPLNIGTYITNE